MFNLLFIMENMMNCHLYMESFFLLFYIIFIFLFKLYFRRKFKVLVKRHNFYIIRILMGLRLDYDLSPRHNNLN